MPGVATVTAEGEAAVTCRVIDTGGQALARRRPPRPEGTHTYSPATYIGGPERNRPLVQKIAGIAASYSYALVHMFQQPG
jgi:hypothetical protein